MGAGWIISIFHLWGQSESYQYFTCQDRVNPISILFEGIGWIFSALHLSGQSESFQNCTCGDRESYQYFTCRDRVYYFSTSFLQTAANWDMPQTKQQWNNKQAVSKWCITIKCDIYKCKLVLHNNDNNTLTRCNISKHGVNTSIHGTYIKVHMYESVL